MLGISRIEDTLAVKPFPVAFLSKPGRQVIGEYPDMVRRDFKFHIGLGEKIRHDLTRVIAAEPAVGRCFARRREP